MLDVGVGADGGFSGASVFVVCQHGALMGCAGGIWQDFGGRRDGNETPYETAFRELREEIGLTASHVDVLPDQPVWVIHAGYRHAVFVATLSEENRLRSDWNLGDEETPEFDSYRNNFVDFANFFADGMVGSEFVHRRIKTREIFDLASSAYSDLRRAAHRAKAAADAAASSDSDDDDVDDDDDSPPAPPQRRPASEATASASQLGDGADRPSAASSVATPAHGRPPDTATAAADAAAALVSAPARVPSTVAEHERNSSALTSYHSGSAQRSPQRVAAALTLVTSSVHRWCAVDTPAHPCGPLRSRAGNQPHMRLPARRNRRNTRRRHSDLPQGIDLYTAPYKASADPTDCALRAPAGLWVGGWWEAPSLPGGYDARLASWHGASHGVIVRPGGKA